MPPLTSLRSGPELTRFLAAVHADAAALADGDLQLQALGVITRLRVAAAPSELAAGPGEAGPRSTPAACIPWLGGVLQAHTPGRPDVLTEALVCLRAVAPSCLRGTPSALVAVVGPVIAAGEGCLAHVQVVRHVLMLLAQLTGDGDLALQLLHCVPPVCVALTRWRDDGPLAAADPSDDSGVARAGCSVLLNLTKLAREGRGRGGGESRWAPGIVEALPIVLEVVRAHREDSILARNVNLMVGHLALVRGQEDLTLLAPALDIVRGSVEAHMGNTSVVHPALQFLTVLCACDFEPPAPLRAQVIAQVPPLLGAVASAMAGDCWIDVEVLRCMLALAAYRDHSAVAAVASRVPALLRVWAAQPRSSDAAQAAMWCLSSLVHSLGEGLGDREALVAAVPQVVKALDQYGRLIDDLGAAGLKFLSGLVQGIPPSAAVGLYDAISVAVLVLEAQMQSVSMTRSALGFLWGLAANPVTLAGSRDELLRSDAAVVVAEALLVHEHVPDVVQLGRNILSAIAGGGESQAEPGPEPEGRHGAAIVGGGDAREASAPHPGPSAQALLPKCHNPMCCAPQEVVADRLSLCGRCQSVAYCSVECQRADWRTHKHVCCAVVEG